VRGAGVKVGVIDTGAEEAPKRDFQGLRTPKHGLAVSSILTGLRGHFEGIAPESEVSVIDLQMSTNIPISAVLKAIESAIQKGVDILSISLGTTDSWGPMQAVINKALDKNILVFAAAGNSGDRGYEYPSACVGAISVASINQARQPSAFNTRNDATVVFAPGEQLSLPLGNGELAEFSGTSFATPFAAGLAALALSEKRATEPRAVMKRRDMIDLLRSDTHLGLNCTTHTYVMEPTCTEITRAQGILNNPSSPILSLVLVMLIIGLVFYVSHL
jgi:membrane-anchored mycosin MYCP